MKTRMKIRRIIGAGWLMTGLLAAGCGGERKVEVGKPPVVKGVATEVVAGSSIGEQHEVVGTVRARTTTVVSAQVAGTITAIRVREGDRVRLGQELVTIDNRDERVQVEKAEAGLSEARAMIDELERNRSAAEAASSAAMAGRRLAQATLSRYRVLHERKSVSDQEFDEVRGRAEVAEAEAERAARMLQVLEARRKSIEARIGQAEADLAAARIRTGYTRLASPLDGVVVARQAEPGSLASPGVPLLTIEGGGSRLEVAVEESRIAGIVPGSPARVVIDALRADKSAGAGEMEGRVVEVVPAAEAMSRTWTVKIDLPAGRGLLSGMFGRARFAGGEREATMVPVTSLVRRGQLTGVYVVDAQSIVGLRLLTLGRQSGERVEVLSGLGRGERIVIDSSRIEREGVQLQ